MLGCVKEVTDFEVTVSLPCGMQGFLSIRNICDSYTKLLSEQLESADTEVGGDVQYTFETEKYGWISVSFLVLLDLWSLESGHELLH